MKIYRYKTTHQRIFGVRPVVESRESESGPKPPIIAHAPLYSEDIVRYESYPIDLAPPDPLGSWRLVEVSIRYDTAGSGFALAVWEYASETPTP